MIIKNKVIISIIPSIELQSVKLLLKGNFCSILIKCWIKSTPFLLKTGTFITLKNCIFMNNIELFSTLQTEICMQHLKTSRIQEYCKSNISPARISITNSTFICNLFGNKLLIKDHCFQFYYSVFKKIPKKKKKKEFCFSFKFYNHKPYTTKIFFFQTSFQYNESRYDSSTKGYSSLDPVDRIHIRS